MSGPEIQDIFRLYGADYLKEHSLLPHIHKTIRAIQNCRTAVLGGHQDICEACGYTKVSYNSCRNRHCPKCQALSKERWILARSSELLPVPYFHVVFTLPDLLDEVVMQNQDVMYNLLFKASQETIRELARDKKYLGAEIGLTAILHTWGQNLTFHPHIHMIVPGGGLTIDGKWKNSRKKFFIPVKVMAKKFRGKFLALMKRAKLSFTGNISVLRDNGKFAGFMHTLYQKDWYVYCKRPFKSNHSVLEYLGRYTHRIAISNNRIVGIDNGNISFKWRDYRDGPRQKIMTLDSQEFIRRFLLHVLPPQFVKIRHYGFLASSNKRAKLALCRKLLKVKTAFDSGIYLNTADLIQKITGIDITACPVCGKKLSRASPDTLTA